jgi:hypothetical protein
MPKIDPKVLARRQKDAEGFVSRYHALLGDREKQYFKDIGPIWQRTRQRLEQQIQRLYKQYADGQGKLQESKLTALRNKIGGRDALKREYDAIFGDIHKPLSEQIGNQLSYEWVRAYYHNAFGLEQAAKIEIKVPTVSAEQVLSVINNPWLKDGKTYSDRLRQNTAILAEKAYQVVGKSVVEGWGVNEAARTLTAVADEGYFNSVRLIRSELTRVMGQAQSTLYMENADVLDGKRWVATKDGRTAARDARNDGKMYDLDYDTPEKPGRPGERIPNHPHCRCRWAPILSALGISTRERIARKGDSKGGYGERYYTKARDYEEYAKERSLPSLNDRLAAENPKKYLRRGETVDDFGPTVGRVPTATPVPNVVYSPGFAPAKTLEEAAKVAERFAEEVHYEKYTLQTANTINDVLGQYFDEFPIPKFTKITYGTYDKKLGPTAGVFRGAIDPSIGFGRGRMGINALFNNPKRVTEMIEDAKSGNSAGRKAIYADNDALRALVNHEMGHVLFMENLSNPELVKEIKALHRAYAKEVNMLKRKYDFDSFTQAKLKLDADAMAEVNRIYISSYADTNLDEWVSEALADRAVSDAPSPYSEKVMEILRKHLARPANPTKTAYVPLNDAKKATLRAKDNLPIDYVNYSSYAPELADSVNSTLQSLYDEYPELVGRIKLVSTSQDRNRRFTARKVEEIYQQDKAGARIYSRYTEEEAKKRIAKVIKPKPTPSEVMAQSTDATWKSESGIAFNEVYAKDYAKLRNATEHCERVGFHPQGTGDPVSVLTHEFAHQIDYFLMDKGVREEISNIHSEWLGTWAIKPRPEAVKIAKDTLSEYAMKNTKEFFAEAFAEYMHNPNPRTFAKRVGEAVEKAFSKLRKEGKT